MYIDVRVVVLLLILQGTGTLADTCYPNGLFGSTIYCDDCCGDFGDEYCCSYIAGGAIAGIVVGSLFGLALLVASIIACCVCMNRSNRTTGMVLQNNQGISVVQSSQSQQGTAMYPPPQNMYPQHGQYPQNGNYPPNTQHPPPPPGYTQQPPAY